MNAHTPLDMRSIVSASYEVRSVGPPPLPPHIGCVPSRSKSSTDELQKTSSGTAGRFAAAQQNTRVDGRNWRIQTDDRDASPARDGAAWQQGHDSNSQACLNHAHHGLGAGRFESDTGGQPALVKRLKDVLPARRTPLIENQSLTC